MSGQRSITAARANLAGIMSRVCDHEETAYLLRSPANARRLLRSIASLEAGQGQEHRLDACDAPCD